MRTTRAELAPHLNAINKLLARDGFALILRTKMAIEVEVGVQKIVDTGQLIGMEFAPILSHVKVEET